VPFKVILASSSIVDRGTLAYADIAAPLELPPGADDRDRAAVAGKGLSDIEPKLLPPEAARVSASTGDGDRPVW